MRDHSIRFKTELFDYKGEIPEDANAGNRFYGKDVDELLVNGMSRSSFSMDFIDEDWGWTVFGRSNDGRFIEVAIYNLSANGTPGQSETNEWGLWIRAFEKRRWLAIFKRNYEIECPKDMMAALHVALSGAGIKPVEWLERGQSAA